MGWCGLAGLGWAGLGRAGLGWVALGWAKVGRAGLGWAGLGCAGLGCAGLVAKTRPRAYPSRQRNAAARRPQTSQKRTKTDAACGPKTPHLHPVCKSLWQCFLAELWQGPHHGLGCAGLGCGLAWPDLCWPGWAGLAVCELGLGWAASPVCSVCPTNQNATSESGKKRLWQSFGKAHTKAWAGLGWAGLGSLAWAGLAPKTRPRSLPLKTAKRSGTAAPNRPKLEQKRSAPAAENGTSESGKKKPLAELWQGPHHGLGWAGLGCGLAWPGLTCAGLAGLGLRFVRWGWAGLTWPAWWAGLAWAELGWA